MSFTVTPLQDDLYTAVRSFLMTILPVDPTSVTKQQANRTAPSLGGTQLSGIGFIEMQIITMRRLSTNIDTWDTTNQAPSQLTAQQSITVEMQLDVYGPVALDWASIISTLWRDDYACQALAPNCQPLHADEPFFVEFTDSEAQYEQRWTVRAFLQYNPQVNTPEQFANALKVSPIINVDVQYKP